MPFRVDPDAIARFGRAVADLRDDAVAAEHYVLDHLDVGPDESRMFAQVAGKASEVRDALQLTYRQLHTVVEGSATELNRTAVEYRTTDTTEAARLDATY